MTDEELIVARDPIALKLRTCASASNNLIAGDCLLEQAASRIEALIAERDRGYERAAEVAEKASLNHYGPNTRGSISTEIATAIRSLKDKTDAE